MPSSTVQGWTRNSSVSSLCLPQSLVHFHGDRNINKKRMEEPQTLTVRKHSDESKLPLKLNHVHHKVLYWHMLRRSGFFMCCDSNIYSRGEGHKPNESSPPPDHVRHVSEWEQQCPWKDVEALQCSKTAHNRKHLDSEGSSITTPDHDSCKITMGVKFESHLHYNLPHIHSTTYIRSSSNNMPQRLRLRVFGWYIHRIHNACYQSDYKTRSKNGSKTNII